MFCRTTKHSKAHARFPKGRRGAAILEFALMSPVLLMLTLLTIDFGRIPFYYIGVTNAARAGAGYAAANPYPYDATARATWATSVQNAISSEMSSNSWYRSGDLTLPTVASIEPTPAQVSAGGYWPASVTVTYTFHPWLTNWKFFGWNNRSTISLTRTVVMQGQI